MPELIVISGKGGTGKTSVTASLAVLAHRVVLVDCDVDASDLHLVLDPTINERHLFSGGNKAQIEAGACLACGKCVNLCGFDAIQTKTLANSPSAKTFEIDPLLCEGCGLCARFCPQKAIELLPAQSGYWFVSQTRCGPMVHARLTPGAGNSGKLIHQLRCRAKELVVADEDLILCDGSPGIGCPVIASLTGGDLALIIVEPSCSGLHDLERIMDLCQHFHMKAVVAINKWDLNATMTKALEEKTALRGCSVVGRIRYDTSFTEAQLQGKAVIEYAPSAGVSSDLKCLWQNLQMHIKPAGAQN